MENQTNTNFFENAISIEELEPRLELAAASSGSVSGSVNVTASYTTGDPSVTYHVGGSVKYSF